MMKGNRLLYIDILKAFGIFLVILGHVLNDNKHPVSHFIYAFHMPLFFALSGLFFNYNKKCGFKDLFAKRWHSLFKPYLFFYITTYLYWVLIERNFRAESGGVEAAWYKPILGLFWQGMEWNLFAHNNPLWFVPCLISVMVLAWAVSFLNGKGRWISLIVFLCLYSLISTYSIKLPWGMSLAFLAFGFFFAGQTIPPVSKMGGVI